MQCHSPTITNVTVLPLQMHSPTITNVTALPLQMSQPYHYKCHSPTITNGYIEEIKGNFFREFSCDIREVKRFSKVFIQ